MAAKNDYWNTRIQKIYDKHAKDLAVDDLYRDVYNRLHTEVKELYSALSERDLTRTELYKSARFLSFRRDLSRHLTGISGSLNDRLAKSLIKAYKDAGLAAKDSIGAKSVWTVQNRKMAEACVQRKWAGDNFSGRIWNNRNQLARQVEQGITSIIITGMGRNDLLRELNKTDYHHRFVAPDGTTPEMIEQMLEAYLQRGRRQADCLVRTELMHTLNTAQIETYKSEGVNYLEFECEPTACPECRAIATDNPYPIDKIPCTIKHPNCRCTWLAVEDEDVEDVKKRYVDKKRENDVDNSDKSGIIKARGDSVALEYQRYGRNKDTLVNKTYIDSGEYRRKFDGISDNKEVNKTLYDCAKRALKHRSGTKFEDMYWIDGDTGKIVASALDEKIEGGVVYSRSIQKSIKGKDNLIAVHTHPASMPPSVADFNSAFINGYSRGYIACHNGKIYGYTAREVISERLYNLYVEDYIEDGFDEFEAQVKAIIELKRNHKIDFWEV